MKKNITILSVILIISSCQINKTDIASNQTIYLYPQGQITEKGLEEASGPLESNNISEDEIFDPNNGNLWNVGNNARIDLYFPEHPNGQMVIVCPGGGYVVLSTENEGKYAAEWLVRKGITAAVLKYRLPNGHDRIPLIDIQNTFRYCRSHAQEWGIKQIGIMGFSAGGHLAATASTLYTDDNTRPDFSILLYPVISLESDITHKGSRDNLLGKELTQDEENYLVKHYSIENQVTENTPPAFIALSSDDNIVPVENSLLYYKALLKKGILAEMHIFPTGNHGWGFRQTDDKKGYNDPINYTRSDFLSMLSRWLDTQIKTCLE